MQEQEIPTINEDVEQIIPVEYDNEPIQGINATIQIGTTATGEAGTNASVENVGTETHAILNFTIPRGDKGDTGDKGDKGDTGDSATIQMNATATTLSAGSQATATITNSGDSHNANYTLALGIPQGIQGERGVQGERGERGERGEQGIQGIQGIQGETGEAFSIYKTYSSIADMNADASNVPEGKFTLIASNVDDPDNSKLFVKNGEGTFTYLTDMSGAQGIQGEQGIQGVQGIQGIQGIQGETGPRGSVKSQYVAELPASGDEDTFYLVDRDLESHTESGEFITLEPTQTAAAIQSAQIDGNATQTGAPTPDSPQPISVVTGENVVKVVGKNLQSTTWGQDFADAINDASRASVQNYDGKNCLKYAVSAGYGSYQTKNFTLGISFQPNTQYTFSFDMLKTNALSRTFAIRYSDGTYTTHDASDAGADEWHHYEITSTAGKNVVCAAPFYTSGDAYIDIDTFQVEIGASASQFVPYQGQDFELNLGKNLLDPSTLRTGYVLSDGNVFTGTVTTGDRYTPFIKVSPNTTYTFEIFETTDDHAKWIGYNEFENLDRASFISPRHVDTTDNFYTFATGATTQYIQLSARNMAGATKFMLSAGGRTTYAPYFTPLELAKIGTYQDRIYKDGEKWYVEKNTFSKTFDGSESWGIQGTRTHTFYSPLPATSMTGICDHFTAISPSGFDVTEGCYLANSNRFIVSFPSMNSADDFKTWLSTHPTTVYYALATPTTTEITDQTLIDQLEALASATLNQGVNNIFTEIATGNAMPTLELNWVEWEKYNRHNVYIWNDAINDWQIIVGMEGDS